MKYLSHNEHTVFDILQVCPMTKVLLLKHIIKFFASSGLQKMIRQKLFLLLFLFFTNRYQTTDSHTGQNAGGVLLLARFIENSCDQVTFIKFYDQISFRLKPNTPANPPPPPPSSSSYQTWEVCVAVTISKRTGKLIYCHE